MENRIVQNAINASNEKHERVLNFVQRLCPISIRFLFAVTVVAISLVFLLQEDLSAQKLEAFPAADGRLRLSASDGAGLYVLRESRDLVNWEPVDLVVLPMLPDNSEKTLNTGLAKAAFYQLQKVGSPGLEPDFFINTVVASNHLATLKYGTEVEVKYFGERDSTGWPILVTRSDVRIGKNRYRIEAADEDGIELLRPSVSALARTNAVGKSDESQLVETSGHGFVVVSRNSENTPIPEGDPVVQLIANDRFAGTVYQEIDTNYVGQYGLDSVYEYEVVLSSTLYLHDVDKFMIAAKSGECAGWAIVAIGAPVVGPGGIFISIGSGLGYFFCIKAIEDDLPIRYDDYGYPVSTPNPRILIEDSARVRGSIPVGGDYNTYSSGWKELFTKSGEPLHGNDQDLPVLFINLDDPPGGRIEITKSWSVSNGFDDSARVRILDFDFQSQLAGVDPALIDHIEWRVAHRTSDVNVTLSTDNPGGVNGAVSLWRWVNGFSSLTPGMVIPRKANSSYLGIWQFSLGRLFSFSLSSSPQSVTLKGGTSYDMAKEGNSNRFGAYYNPFSVEVIAYQHAVANSHTFGLAPPVLQQTNASFGGNVTITIVLKGE